MKLLYLECAMGAAGDMLMAALFDLLDETGKQQFLTQMNHLGLPGVTVSAQEKATCGIVGKHMQVLVQGQEEENWEEHTHHHHHIEEEHAHLHIEEEHVHHHAEKHVHYHAEEEHHHHAEEHVHYQAEKEHHHHHAEEEHHHHHEGERHHHHTHTDMAQMRGWIQNLPVGEEVKSQVEAVYQSIAEAESHAHGQPIEQIHFHEVGSLDALADVTGVCLLMSMLSPEKVVVSPVHVGSGTVRCAHGILPVPAPATAFLLQGVPIYGGEIKGELCTPTGAALLTHFADSFGLMPVMRTEKIGIGVGTREFAQANCVRAFLGETQEKKEEAIVELAANLDDMTGEELGGIYEPLFEAGALDVSLLPAVMKKNRPGYLLLCVCKPEREEELTRAMMLHTTTLGVRRHGCSRTVLEREIKTVDTPYGLITMKRAYGMGIEKWKPEWEDVKRIAKENGVTAREVLSTLSIDHVY